MFCVCGLYLRINKDDPKVAFIDICDKRNLRDRSKFQFYNKETHPNRNYTDLDCSKTIKDDNNETQWNKIPTSFNNFKCAKINTGCESYVVILSSLEPLFFSSQLNF
jgi:hypothetical protein